MKRFAAALSTAVFPVEIVWWAIRARWGNEKRHTFLGILCVLDLVKILSHAVLHKGTLRFKVVESMMCAHKFAYNRMCLGVYSPRFEEYYGGT